MSNRRMKSLDYDDDDLYDDEYDDEEDDGITEEDREQLQKGTAKVRDVLGPSVQVSDKEIQDSLWHYYYDVDKTVTYILSQKAASEAKAAKQAAAQKKQNGSWHIGGQYPGPPKVDFHCESAKDFFSDCPWGAVPEARRAFISVEPIYPRGGLLGGSSQGGPKKSKLAALAAARRKENATPEKAAPETVNASVALLDKLSINKELDGEQKAKRQSEEPLGQPRPRKYPVRKLVKEASESAPKAPSPEPEAMVEDEPTAEIAAPSAFAQVLCGPEESTPKLPQLPTTFHAYQYAPGQGNPFAGPSPDDIVIEAQKGSKSLNKKNTKK